MEKQIHAQKPEVTLSPPVAATQSRQSHDGASAHTGMAASYIDPSYLEPEPQDTNLATGETNRETEGWSTLLKYSKEFDDKMLGEWQDELANLLTFTGLFSAVVTGFIVVTIPQLQEDPNDKSSEVLTQISQQLASFTFINGVFSSTFQPPPPEPFKTDETSVSINVLWMTSLTLSLMAAFWTIAVQQWLRQFPLPRETTVRESVRLRQLRYDGLMTWKVPAIVSLLPLCMQVSVLFFLVGLLLYLRSLNRTVADSFAIIGGVLFALYLVTIPLPLIFPICPYKSPLLPTCGFFIQALVLPIIYPTAVFLRWFTTRAFIAILHILYQFLGLRHLVKDGQWMDNTRDALQARVVRVGSWLYRHVLKELAIVHPVLFWTLRELRSIRQKRQTRSAETSAVASAPIAIPEAERPKVLACLEALPDDQRRAAATSWVCLDLGLLDTDMNPPIPIDLPGLYNGCLETLDHSTLVRLRRVLLHILPSTWNGYQWAQAKLRVSTFDALYTSAMALMLWSTRWVLKHDLERDIIFLEKFVAALIEACDSQIGYFGHMVDRGISYVWLPTTILFALSKRRCILDKAQTLKAISRACALLRVVNEKAAEARSRDFKEVLEGVLGATATALIPITNGHAPASDHEVRTGMQALLALFNDFVATPSFKHAVDHLHLLRPLDTAKILMIDAAAIKSIAHNLQRLADKGHISQSADCPSRYIVAHLFKVCSSHEVIYEAALERLDTFRRRWPAPAILPAVAQPTHGIAPNAIPLVHTLPQRDSAFSEKAEEAV